MAETQLDRIEHALSALSASVTNLTQLVRTDLSQELQMANVLDSITAQVTALSTEVAAETTVNQSAITLLNGLSTQIAALAANAADPAQVAQVASQLTALASSIHTNAADLAAAVTANTPAAPPAQA
jgi:hypothetical protein